MKRTLFAVHLMGLCLFLIISGCQNTTEGDNEPPPQVQLISKSPDSALVETGIDAQDPETGIDPSKNGIYLEWHPLQINDLRSYRVYRRAVDTTGNFSLIAEIAQSFGSTDTSFLDTNVELQIIYYYYVTAEDEDGLESDPSRLDHYTLLPKPNLVTPTGRQDFQGRFAWTFSPNYVPLNFIFRLDRVVGEEYLPLEVKLLETIGNNQPDQDWGVNQVGIAALTPGVYRWRIDVRTLRDDRLGAESEWGFFVVR